MLDSDRLLVLVDSAEQEKTPTIENRLHYYAFFAKEEGVRFTYNFQILRSLYSTALHEDLKTLEEGRYLVASSGFQLTDKGRDWITRLPEEEIEETRKPIINVIRKYANMDELTLFRDAYAKLTSGL